MEKNVLFLSLGLSLDRAGDLTLQSFTLVCDLQGATLVDPVVFTYDGNSAGGCSSPPSPTCNSPYGTITTDSLNTLNITLNQNEIKTRGNAIWTCSHSSLTATYNATVICKLYSIHNSANEF